VYTERHYCVVAVLKTLAVMKSDVRSRRHDACNTFLRLAADFLLQQGAHGDAARVFCASWLTPGRKDSGMEVDAGLFETIQTSPRIESAFIEGGWPIAHELGHVIAANDDAVPEYMAQLLKGFISESLGGRPPAWAAPGESNRIIAEMSADWVGAELLLCALAGQPVDALVLVGEFASNMWAMALMESCRDVVRRLGVNPGGEGAALDLAMYDARANALLSSLWADISGQFVNAPEREQLEAILRNAMTFYRSNFQTLLEGMSIAEHTLRQGVGGAPLLQDLDPGKGSYWDKSFRAMAYALSRSLPWFGWAAREFVNRAQATRNSREQSTGLLDFLDRLAPEVVPTPARRLLNGDEIDVAATGIETLGGIRRMGDATH
jgi:hypothetical protein